MTSRNFMRFHIIFLAVFAIISMFLIPTSAESVYKENYYTYTISDNTATIVDFDEETVGTVVIPNTLGGYPVTKIGDEAFNFSEHISSVDIPEGVTEIGTCVFSGCKLLQRVIIPSSVKSIGDSAFGYCASLEAILVDRDNRYFKMDDAGALYNKDMTELICYPVAGDANVVLPSSLELIGMRAFAQFNKLENIVIPANVKYIESEAFLACKSLERVNFEEGSQLMTIGEDAFFVCDALKSVNLPSTLTCIEFRAFSNCTQLTEIELPGDLTHIMDSAFCATGIKHVTIPASVTYMEDSAFYHCTQLESVTFEEGGKLENIPDSAFKDCKNLKRVAISSNIKNIEIFAFHNCNSLSNVYYSSNKAAWKQIQISFNNDDLIDARKHYNKTMPDNVSDNASCQSIIAMPIIAIIWTAAPILMLSGRKRRE